MVEYGIESTLSEMSFSHWSPFSINKHGSKATATLNAISASIDSPFSINLSGKHLTAGSIAEEGLWA